MPEEKKQVKEYNDGSNLTHYLGNDDYVKKNKKKGDRLWEDEDPNAGREAQGNNLQEKPQEKH